ncbi:MAG: hypothetical protein HHAS10_06420 [Candidatus Altimarinota bacterium]
MKTRTIQDNQSSSVENTSIQNEISEQVDERGFYLYEWISPDELRMSVQADYLSIVKKASIPLAIITFIMGFIGLAIGGIIGVFGLILITLGVFYTIVFFYLVLRMLHRAYQYTRGADVIITDHHYVTGGRIIAKDDFRGQQQAFEVMERLFREPLFESSQLEEYIKLEQKGLFNQLKEIAYGGGKMIEKIGRSRDSGGIIAVILIGGILYGGMMALVYFLGVFFVAIGAHIFSWFAHRTLLAMNNLEHEVQTLFSEITDASIELKSEKKLSVSLLSEANRNEWKENLSGKLEDSFEIVAKKAEIATKKSIELQKLLSSSKYKDIFNFTKYGMWVKTQILEPLEEIHDLLEKNSNTLESIAKELDIQIKNSIESSHKKPLELQKERIKIQQENIKRILTIIDGYIVKLNGKRD